MFNKLLAVISIIVIASVLIFRFLSFTYSYLPNWLRQRNEFKFFGVGIFTVAALLTVTYHFLPGLKSDNPIIKLLHNKKYSQDAAYWHPYLQYRNDQITKIINPISSERMAIFGKWKKIEEVGCKISSNGSIVTEFIKIEYFNDSIITIKSSFPNSIFRFHFNDQTKLARFEKNSPDIDIVKNYEYDSDGRFSESTQSTDSLIFHNQSVVYQGDSAHTITTTLRDGEVFQKEFWKYDQKGSPIAMELSMPSIKNNTKHLGIVSKSEIKYQGQKQISTIYDFTENIKYKEIYDRRLGFLETKYDGNPVNPKGPNLNKYSLESDNWTRKLSIKNGEFDELFLRKITYADGSIEGSVDTDGLELSRLIFNVIGAN